MTDIRNTQSYETLTGSGEGDVRLTENYEALLANNADADIRQTQAYAFMLGNTPDPDFYNTQSYFQTLQEGTDALRDTFTYFQMLGNEVPPFQCAVSSFIPSGQTASALAAPIDPGPLAFSSTFGPKGEIL